MSSNPKSINYRNTDLANDGRDVERAARNADALAATSGKAELAEGNKSKAAVQKSAASSVKDAT